MAGRPGRSCREPWPGASSARIRFCIPANVRVRPPNPRPAQPQTPLEALTFDPRYVDAFPFAVTRAILERGRERYNIFCVVCHDPLGTGRGKIVERGYTPPPSYHEPRLRQAPVGHFFDVITHGFGSMPDYQEQVPPRDRWAIAAYIRALQLSQHTRIADLSEPDRQRIQEGGAAR